MIRVKNACAQTTETQTSWTETIMNLVAVETYDYPFSNVPANNIYYLNGI